MRNTGFYYYSAHYYNPRESLWLSVDPLADYNPVMNDEHYIDGEHNGGVFNSFNGASYGYCYLNPVIYVDPNGKQSYWGGLFGKTVNEAFSSMNKTIQSIPDKVSNWWNDTTKYKPNRVNGKVVISNTEEATRHYFRGKGEVAVLDDDVKYKIKNAEITLEKMKKIREGKTTRMKGNWGVDLEFDSWKNYHVGDIAVNYKIDCSDGKCTATYSTKDGFWDIFTGDDGLGPNGELGGTPYKYETIKWSETFDDPGYKTKSKKSSSTQSSSSS